MRKLPTIEHKGKTYTFDERLSELRLVEGERIEFIRLTNMEAELLNYAVSRKNKMLIKVNMKELEGKGKIRVN